MIRSIPMIRDRSGAAVGAPRDQSASGRADRVQEVSRAAGPSLVAPVPVRLTTALHSPTGGLPGVPRTGGMPDSGRATLEFQDVVRRRRMVRSFEDRPIPPAVAERIVANAQRAPSAGFSQGWAFLVLEGKEETARYWDALWPLERRAEFGWPDMFNAPLLIVCLSHKRHYLQRYAEPDKGWTDMDERRWPVPYWDIDTGMAALLMLLTAVDAGLGAVFFGVPDQARLRATFGVPDDFTAIGTVAIGFAKSGDRPSPSLRRGHRSAGDVIHRGAW